jgi:8-oxo-dGTP diphosphatase
MKKVVEVAVGVIKANNKIFISKRHDTQHQGGLWEFPGGKVETGETVFEALKRELKEEINIDVNSSFELKTIDHDYTDKSVRLSVHLVEDFTGEAKGLESQTCQWVSIDELVNFDFPEANKEIISLLQSQN